MAVSANRLELLQIADAVAREKSIDRMIVIESMQDAIEKAAKTRYGAETNVRAEINPKTGELRLWRLLEVVEAVPQAEVSPEPTPVEAEALPPAEVVIIEVTPDEGADVPSETVEVETVSADDGSDDGKKDESPGEVPPVVPEPKG